jgi:alkylhydroperoxidase family enzyme
MRRRIVYRDIAAHFTEEEMVDLTIAIGLMNVFNRIAIGFRCDPASS